MRRIFIAFALVAVLQGIAAAQDKTGALTLVHQFMDAFNKGDAKAALASCADQTSIIDEFAPYEWSGSGGCAKWMNDYDADVKKNGITDGFVTLGAPHHLDVTGDRAYVVVPADYVYKQKGKPEKETGSILTVALQKGASGWRIVGWAWTKH